MFVVLGLIILVVAVVVGVAGVFNNVGSGHALTHGFSLFGYHITGSTGTLFLYGIVVGAAGMLGLGMLLAGARRTSRRGRAARRELKQSRPQTAAVSQDRDLIGQRENAQAEIARSETARADETTRAKTARLQDHEDIRGSMRAGRRQRHQQPRRWASRERFRAAAERYSSAVGCAQIARFWLPAHCGRCHRLLFSQACGPLSPRGHCCG